MLSILRGDVMDLVRRIIVSALILILIPDALVFGTGAFTGRWEGEWRNSLGETGADSLALREDPDGTLNGIWTSEIEVSGNRINANTVELRGRTATRSYQITATLNREKNELELIYIFTRLNTSGSYQGSSRLYRIR
jgi:hypothetical protein